MTKINLQKNKAPVPYEAKGFRSGFVLLFAVTLSAILLSVALGVLNIAFKEVKFSTSAKDTNDAFFAADTGIECAEYNDKSTSSIFTTSSPSTQYIICLGNNNVQVTGPSPVWKFIISGLGSSGKGCAIVTVDKTQQTVTTVTSDGYNNGGSSNTCSPTSNTVQREVQSTY